MMREYIRTVEDLLIFIKENETTIPVVDASGETTVLSKVDHDTWAKNVAMWIQENLVPDIGGV